MIESIAHVIEFAAAVITIIAYIESCIGRR